MMVLKEKKEMDDCFKKAQKPWVKILNKVDKAKLDYHNACKAERSASNQERNATGDNAVSPEQVSWLDLISRIKDREWIGQFVTAIGNLLLYISQHLSIMLPHTFSSITPAKENEKCQFPREEAGRVSFFLYGRMYRMGYGNGDPIAGGGLGKLLACVLQHTHIEGEASAERGGGEISFIFLYVFWPKKKRVACLFYCRRVFCHRGVFVTLFHVVNIPLRSANCRSAFNEPKRRCNEPRRSTRPPCRRSIHTTPSTWRTCKKCLTSASKWRPNDSLSSKKFSSISTKDWISVRIQREFDMSCLGCPLYYYHYPRNTNGRSMFGGGGRHWAQFNFRWSIAIDPGVSSCFTRAIWYKQRPRLHFSYFIYIFV